MMHKKLLISMSFLAMMLFAGMATAAEMVNINKASAAAIQQNLVGIGPIKAEAIVSYRKKNGKFKTIDDLQNVTGLGPAIIKKNKRYLSMTKGVVAGDDKAYSAAKKQAGKSKTTGTKKPATDKTTKSVKKAKTEKTTTTDKAAKSDTKSKSTKAAKKSEKTKSTTETKSKASKKTTSKTKTSKTKKKAKTSKSAKKNCSSSNKTMSKAEKKACAAAKAKKKKSSKKKTKPTT